MRAILFYCCFACAVVLCITASDVTTSSKPDAQAQGFKGAVNFVHSEMLVALRDGGLPTGVPFTQEDSTFDRDGWLTEWVRYVDGQEMMHEVYRREGPIVLHKETTYSGPRNHDPHKALLTNDRQGRPTELLIYTLDGKLKQRTVYQYETAGTRVLTYDGSGRLLDNTFRTERTEHAKGMVLKEGFENGHVRIRVKNSTTPDGSHTETVSYSRAGTVTSRQIKDIGTTGETSAFVSGTGTAVAGTKDVAGNMVQIVEESNGNRTVTTSSPKDRRIEYYNKDGKLRNTITTNYSEGDLDEHGNWIRATQYITRPNSEPRVNSITTRKITYYE